MSAFVRGGAFPKLAARLEAFFVRHRHKLVFVHAAMFLLFAGLLAVPLITGGTDADSRHIAVAARYLIWGVWFPLVFLSVIATGRSWCGILCPMGAASEWANRAGLRLPIPRWVQWPGTPVVSFILITIWAQTAGARDHALGLAIVFGSTLAAALLLGFFFGRRKRAWCRHMCPIGLLLGVYARIGAVDFRPKQPQPGGDRWTETNACPTMIDLPHKTESRHCIECFRCVSPKAKSGLYLRLRPPGEEVANIRDHHPNLSEVMFVFLGTGASLGGFLWLALDSYQWLRQALGDFVIARGWYWLGEPGPVWLMSNYPAQGEVFRWFDFFLITGYMLAWTLAAAAVFSAATALAAWLSGRAGGDGDWRARFVELGYQFIPVAMVSLLLGLGGALFETLGAAGVSGEAVGAIKVLLLAGGVIWSGAIGFALLARQGVPARRRLLPLLPGIAASLAAAAVWYPAIFAG